MLSLISSQMLFVIVPGSSAQDYSVWREYKQNKD